MDHGIKLISSSCLALLLALAPLRARAGENSAETVSRLMDTAEVKKKIQACAVARPHPDLVNFVMVIKPKGRVVLSSTVPSVDKPLLKCFRSAVHKHVRAKATGGQSMVFHPMQLDAPEKEKAVKPAGKVKIRYVSAKEKAEKQKPVPTPVKGIEKRSGSRVFYHEWKPILYFGVSATLCGAFLIAAGASLYGLWAENVAPWASLFAIGGLYYFAGLVLCGVSARLRKKAEESLHASAIPGLSVSPIAAGRSRGVMAALTWAF